MSALRFYEQLGPLTSERDPRGRRVYAPEVLRRIAFISVGTSVCLTLAEIRHELDRLPLRDCALANQRDRAAVRGAGPRFLLGDDPRTTTDGSQSPRAAMPLSNTE